MLAELGGRLRLVPTDLPGLVAAPGVTEWQGRALPSELAHCLRIWPQHNDTGGFFVAVLEMEVDPGPEPAPETTRAPEAATLDSADGAERLVGLATKYGLPDGARAAYRVHRQTRRGLHLLAADHAPALFPRAESSGLFFHRTNVRPPKPTTAGAMLFGRAATRSRLELSRSQRDSYLRRDTFGPTAEQPAANPPGQVLVSYRGHILGVGVLYRSGVIESLFPSRWSGCTAGARFGIQGSPGKTPQRPGSAQPFPIAKEAPMAYAFSSIEAAFQTLAEPSNPAWAAAFAFLSAHPETAALMIETFRETLEHMGVAPSGTDPATGEPAYGLWEIAQAMGVPEADLDAAVDQATSPTDGGAD